MNAAIKLFMVIVIGVEISFIQSVPLNLCILAVSCCYLLIKRVSIKSLLYLIIYPIIPATGLLVSQLFYGIQGPIIGWVLFTRLFAYVWLGATFTMTTNIKDLAFTLEQNFRLPSKFAYGVLTAFNLVPRIITEVQTIRHASLMRGVTMQLWSPKLYFKAILAAINWSSDLSQAMISHGFVEDAPRTHVEKTTIRWSDFAIFAFWLILVQVPIFVF
ncbi:energy-coupling factor transporter transmembrane protein EcfT [Lactobacillus sp. Sy-1]|uniref:energy-coupling factor transporter transmembrane component T family protein n=1 Tax=Lactobacillus sp. Sy-1 TaxID=2109645 RepID=UPI001C5833CE|nr:energy-coupling factor transporter transmembrane component T [Lactobacillus sp. Sy-1]MBW1605253.1 energy-coupling factor transporter transmembrane protein EcfT [Lactobacillus sp. Sy-1]